MLQFEGMLKSKRLGKINLYSKNSHEIYFFTAVNVLPHKKIHFQ